MANIKIADKDTLDAVHIIAEDINTKIGNPADLENAGSVMGKLNKVMDELDSDPTSYATDNIVNVIDSAIETTLEVGDSKRLTSFTPTRSIAYNGYVLGDGYGTGSGFSSIRVFVSTISTNGAAVSSLESNNVYDSGEYRNVLATYIPIATRVLVANTTYYIHVICTAISTGTKGYKVTNIYMSSEAYNTSIRYPTIIKSVQRGYGGGIVKINKVNPNKCLVTINDRAYYESNPGVSWLLAPDFIVFRMYRTATGYAPTTGWTLAAAVEWQITEFY